MTEKKTVGETAKKEFARLLAETNILQFRCDCGKRFMMEQPEGKWVRHNKETTFFIKMNDENSKHTPISCPSCYKTNGIRRVAPVWRAQIEKPKKEVIIPNDWFSGGII